MTPHHPRRTALRVETLERRDQPAVVPPSAVAVGAEPGAVPDVTLIDPTTDAVVGRVRAYADTFAGGVRVAVGDLNGDGVADLVTGPGPGGGPQVRVFDGRTGEPVASFFAYDEAFRGGVNVAVGDLDGDGRPEIVTGAGDGGGPVVRTFEVAVDAAGRVTAVTPRPGADFFAYEPGFRGGVFVAAGDLDGDGAAEIILGTGVGGGPRVRAVRGTPDHAEVLNFFAYEDAARNGVRVAAGDLDGDGRAEVVTGTGPGAGPRVRVVDGGGTAVADFFAFDPAARGGVEVGVSGGRVVARSAALGDTLVRRFDTAGQTLGEVVVPYDPVRIPLVDPSQETLTAGEVETLLRRAAAASASRDAIIAVVDRNGRILGVRVEGGVADEVAGDAGRRVFAIDGAVAKARTAALFANDQAPLTSRTVRFISQSTVTQREVESDPNVTDPNSPARGPGFVAPVGVRGHFPPGIALTPSADLFGIEHTNRDGTYHPGADRIKGTADDVRLRERFNIDPAFVPAGQSLFPQDSYGFVSGLRPGAQGRGIGTLPGGVPVVKDGRVVGGVGVFFPGRTGFATAENAALDSAYNRFLPDRSAEAEWIAFAAVGGYATAGPVGDLGGVPVPAGFGLPFGRIDLLGISLDLVGPGGEVNGLAAVRAVGAAVGRGDPADGADQPVAADGAVALAGAPVPQGWLVVPHDGAGVTAAEVERVITQGIAEANRTRAAIRLPASSRTRMTFAVADRTGAVVGLYRMPDATTFSIDVAVAKARNVTYYADPAELQPADQVAGVPAGTAFTNRTLRYLALPFFPEGIDGTAPAPFSQFTDGGADPAFARTVGAPLPASAYQSVFGYDAFNPGTNFRDPTDILNQNGVVFFPGSAPLYRGSALVGGLGVSGDGVSEDDVVTLGGSLGFDVPATVLRADQVFVRGVRLPYQNGSRNPRG